MSTLSHSQLTPLRFLERSAEVFPGKVAIVHGDRRTTYRDFAREATRLARALRASGIEAGDRVAYMCPNIPELLIAHFAVPLAGAVLVAINTRLATEEVRYICEHSGAKLLVVDSELRSIVAPLQDELALREIVTVTDPVAEVDDAEAPGPSYADLLERGSDEPLAWSVDDELAPITINYTSGTTGKPKGVVYTHRGAYLNSLGEVMHSEHTADSVYLWTLPMFHCNGWCTAWGVTAIGGRHVCLRAVRGDRIWQLLEQEKVTHLNGAPTVLTTMAGAEEAHPLERTLVVTTAGAPPSPTTIAQCEGLNARILHVYGLTETYGPYSVCQWQEGWEDLDVEERATLLSRQGVGMIYAERLRVVDEEMNDVPGGRRDDGRDRHARQRRDEGLLRGRSGDGRGVQGRLVPLRRPRGHAGRRLRAAPRPRQGRGRIRRGEHLHRRDRAGAPHPRGGAGRGGHRGARREVGRAPQGVRGAQARRGGRASRSSSTT